MNNSSKTKSPWLFVPTLYIAQGMPFVLVNQLSTAMFKSLQASNEFIGFTSFLYLPWSLKMFWAPFVDATSTKRNWILWMQVALAVALAMIAFGLQINSFLLLTIVIFTAIAFLSATHDIAIDGFYLHALDKQNQALFTGIRSTFYRVAMIFAGGILVSIAGYIGTASSNVSNGWTFAFGLSALIFILLFVYHRFVLPLPATDLPIERKNETPYKVVFKEYFSQKRIGVILAFILTFRFGEALLLKMAQPFLLDAPAKGGLGLSLSDVGLMYGTFGVLSLVAGGIIGGVVVKKFGVKKTLLPFALSMHVPLLLFVYMSIVRPMNIWHLDLSWLSGTNWGISIYPIIQLCIIIEQFGYGFGFTAFMVYLLYISKGKYKASHYAISTGIMAIGMMLPGFLSGVIQAQIGYTWLFVVSFVSALPGMATFFFLPFDEE